MDHTLPRNDEVRPAADADPDELTRRIAELEARIDELERERAADVERLHTAQAALANTQVELLRATRDTKGAAAPIAAPVEPRATAIPPRPDVARDATPTNGSVDVALRRRIARFQDDLHAYRESIAGPPAEAAAPQARRQGSDAPAPERRVDRDLRERRVDRDQREPRSRNGSDGSDGADGAPNARPGADEPGFDDVRLSLRERLASAANARHHVALNEAVSERRDASGAIPPPP